MYDLLLHKGYLYVCGDAAHMAREVNSTIANIIATSKGISMVDGEEEVRKLRESGQYQVRKIPHSAFYISLYKVS